MFTGIVEEIGTVQNITRQNDSYVLHIQGKKVFEQTQIGDSISVNGVCLTVTGLFPSYFSVDVMPETVYATSLKTVKAGSKVNLERAMKADGRFGGHIVSGHVDGTATIMRKTRKDNAVYVDFKLSDHLADDIIFRGSISIDGTSLTVFGIKNNILTVSIIPHTLEQTVIGLKTIGDVVNIETDMLGKYVKHHLNKNSGNSLSEDFLKSNGFF
jgi:riboflavin synthase